MLKPLTLAALLAAASHASAQCALPTATFGNNDPSGVARVGAWDPDGPGPLPEQPVIAGRCDASFPGSGFGVYAWDGHRWNQLASSFTFPTYVDLNYSYITTLRTWDPDGPGPLAPRLLIAGAFTSINGVPAAGIATWDGSTWSPLGEGLNSHVYTTTDWDPDGAGPMPPRLVAGGFFTASGTAPIGHIAMWNGTAWTNVGWGLDDKVESLTTWDPDGPGPLADRLIAGGYFHHAGSDSTGQINANGMAQWNGTAWEQMPGVAGASFALTTWDHDGLASTPRRLVGSAYFTTPLGYDSLTQAWDGATWSLLPDSNRDYTNRELVSHDPDGAGPAPESLYAINNATAGFIRKWDGTTWVNVVPGLSSSYSSQGLVAWHQPGSPDRLLVVGFDGYLNSVLRVGDGVQWTSWGNSLNGSVRALLSWDSDGPGPQNPTLLAAGYFTASSTSGDYISRWDGNDWRPLGWGTDAPIHALTAWDPDGPGPLTPQPIAGGEFANVGSDSTGAIPANHIARWDGTSWRALGAGVDGVVRALTTFDADGPGPSPSLLIAAGQFSHAGNLLTGGIASWDGTQWRALGWGLNGPVFALTTWDPDGPGPQLPQVVAAGDFTYAGASSTGQVGPCSIARWNGTAWIPMGTYSGVRTLVTYDADGQGPQAPQLLAGGTYGIVRWTGTTWSTFAGGFTFADFYHSAYRTEGIDVPAAANYLAVWDIDGDGPAIPQLFASGTYTFSVPPYQEGKMEYPGGIVTRNVVARFNGLSFTKLLQNQPYAPLLVHDTDGPGPNASQLIIGGDSSPYIFSLPTSTTMLVTSSPSYTPVRAGDAAQFSVTATGGAPTYQWQYRTSSSSINSWTNLTDGPRFNGATITGSTSSTLTIASVTSSSYGYFRCLIYEGGCLAHTTDQAYLQVRFCGTADFNRDGDFGTDADIESFFACLAGHCCWQCSADFNADGDSGTDADIESFFRVLAGGNC